ncbi:MAG: hypothetical protein GY771_03890 [bacterium]|nr:hypothetical protein [bacterium]
MRRPVIIFFSLLYSLTAVGVSAETVYATVGGYAVTSTDISLSLGYLPSGDGELNEAIEGVVERYAVLAIAEEKGYNAGDAEVTHAIALMTKIRGANTLMSSSAHREYVRQELVIGEYIDDYIYPRIVAGEEQLFTLFTLNPYKYTKYPPKGKAALKKVFPRYRNAVLNEYVTLQVGRLLAEEIESARAALGIEYYR